MIKPNISIISNNNINKSHEINNNNDVSHKSINISYGNNNEIIEEIMANTEYDNNNKRPRSPKYKATTHTNARFRRKLDHLSHFKYV